MARAQDAIPFTWDQATVYYVTPDRFHNGDPENDHAYGRGLYGAGRPYPFDEAGHFHGGDLKGLTRKLEEGYFEELGVNVLRITAPYEQVHGWVEEDGAQAYAYRGGWALDYTEVDAGLGTASDLQSLVDTAHERGLRVVFDVVLNHVGPPTLSDMTAYDFGVVRDDAWESSRPADGESWGGFQERFVVRDDTSRAWARWWGPGWVRADLPGYEPCGSDDMTRCAKGLPDVRTDTQEPVELPPFLADKWGGEKLAGEEKALDAFFSRTGYPRLPHYYIIKWLTDWVRTYGVDGFYVGDVRQVEPEVWTALKQEAGLALDDWKAAHPARADGDLGFWMVGEARGQGASQRTYRGFDALINDSFTNPAAAAGLDSLYTRYAGAVGAAAGPAVLSVLPAQAGGFADAGTGLFLAPGGIQIDFGTELDPTGTAPATRPSIDWKAAPEATLEHWQKLGRFRHRHPAVSSGSHEQAGYEPYIFYRTARYGALEDKVVVVLGAEGRTRINVSRFFPDDTALRDAYTGKVSIVSFGMVSFPAHERGILLIEEL
jgi:alpha-amylase